MTATNHYLTGVLIASTINKPLVALPLAFASHFVLDCLPHFGDKNFMKKIKTFKLVWSVDFILLIGFLTWTLINCPIWYAFAGFLGTSPDIAWIYRFYIRDKILNKKLKPMIGFNRFHAGIQKLERSWGLYVEIAYATGVFWAINTVLLGR